MPPATNYTSYLSSWTYVVLEYDSTSSTQYVYLNGSLATSSADSIVPTSTQTGITVGAWPGQSLYHQGNLDEFRVSTAVRSADWTAAEYHNQSSPSTFYSVGSATTALHITSLSRTWGEIDTEVTITGTSFGSTQGSSTVTFNGTAATATSWSATSIDTTVPSGATTGNVVVTVSSVASNGVSFTVSSGGGSDSSGIYYYFSDQLGTARVITDSSGTVCYDGDMYPYGGERAYTDVCDSNYKFTGKERDSESGLDNFGARYDSSQYGRFMTPDPLYIEMHRLVDPQQLNLYSYARNNPLKFTDPTGLDINCDGDRCDDYLKALQRDARYKLALNNGKVATEGDIDKEHLSKSEKALLSAIDDTKHHVTIHAIDGSHDSSVFFGRSDAPGEHTIAFGQTSLLDQPKNAGGFSSADLVGHETLEGYSESLGNSFSDAHRYATGFFGDLGDPTNGAGLVQGGMVIGIRGDFSVGGRNTMERITTTFDTPVPVVDFQRGTGAPYRGYPSDVEKKK